MLQTPVSPMAKRKQSPRNARSRLRAIWCHMMARCNNPADPSYSKYGARGIRVCERWHDFENFYADMHPRPDGKSLDRYPDGAGNYEPSNVRWATSREQIINRRVTRWITFQGETL